MRRWQDHAGLARPRHTAAAVAAMALLSSCVGATNSPTSTLPPAVIGSIPAPSSSPSAGPSSSTKPSASPSLAPSAEASSLEAITFDVSGSIGGKPVSGRLTNGMLTVPCSAAGANQVLVVHWTGSAPPSSVPLQGEIDLKPGTWTFGSGAQGTASVGLEGGKATDSLVPSSGTVTTTPAGGSIDATFTSGADSLHLSGSWVCPKS